MPSYVLGYKRTSTSQRGKVHNIHLQLRHPRTHALLDYKSIAGIMCHELVHCVHGSHDAKFYEAMNEIEEQYVGYLAKGVVLGKDGFPLGGGGIPLGRGGGGGERHEASLSSKIYEAADSRRKKGQKGLTRGYVLGGEKRKGSPREAAGIAAHRRFLDSQYCLPCNEIIELLGEDDDSDDSEVAVVESSTKTAGLNTDGRSDTKMTANDDGVIDLTLDDSFTTMSRGATLKSPFKRKSQSKQIAHLDMAQSNTSKRAAAPRDLEIWNCCQCTLINPPTVLVCIACHSERPCDKTVLEQAKELQKQDDVNYMKRREVQQSKETFGGFNIYGEKKDSSSTMKHLT